MASVEEVRQGILISNQHTESALAAMHHAGESLRIAQSALMHAVEGSGQADASAAVGLLGRAQSSLDEAIQAGAAAISDALVVAGHL